MSKDELIQDLEKSGVLENNLIKEAFLKIDRADFVPDYEKFFAYENHPLDIGFGQTISQPYTVAFMLSLLSPKPGEKILEIGAGSGWQTALLGYMVSKKVGGKVIAIERIKELAEFAKKNILKYSLISKHIKIIVGNGALGYEKDSPYDKIIGAASGKNIPEAWKQQLKIGGKIVTPVEESIWEIYKKSKTNFEIKKYPGFVFVPLIES